MESLSFFMSVILFQKRIVCSFLNQHREFFRVNLEDIKSVIKENYDKTVEFVDVAPAEQYRESLILKTRK